MKKLLLATAIASSIVASNAYADNSKSFEGLNVQVGSGYQHSSGQFQDIRINGADVGLRSSKASDENVPLIFGIGYTAAIANDFTLGAIFEYNTIKSKAGYYDFTNSDGSVDENDGNIKIKKQYSISLVPGYAFDKTTLGYAKIGYASNKANVSYTNGDPDESYSLHGWIFGLGAKKLLNDNAYVFGEFNYIKNNDKNLSVTDGSYTLTGKMHGNAYNGIVGVGYKF
jgi:hypothetical protein